MAVEPPPAASVAQDAAAAQDALKQELATAKAAAKELKMRNDQAAKEKAAAEVAARIAQQEREMATAEKAKLEKAASDAAMAALALAEDKRKAEADAQKAIDKMKADQIEQQAAAVAAAAAEAKRSIEAALSQAVGTPGIDCEWVSIGDPRNRSDNTGFGAVTSSFEVSKFPITNLQYADFLNTSSRGRTNDTSLFHEGMASSRQGGIRQVGRPGAFRYEIKASMADAPVNFVSWFAAVRLANWLHNGGTVEADTETGAYLLGEPAGVQPRWPSRRRSFGCRPRMSGTRQPTFAAATSGPGIGGMPGAMTRFQRPTRRAMACAVLPRASASGTTPCLPAGVAACAAWRIRRGPEMTGRRVPTFGARDVSRTRPARSSAFGSCGWANVRPSRSRFQNNQPGMPCTGSGVSSPVGRGSNESSRNPSPVLFSSAFAAFSVMTYTRPGTWRSQSASFRSLK